MRKSVTFREMIIIGFSMLTNNHTHSHTHAGCLLSIKRISARPVNHLSKGRICLLFLSRTRYRPPVLSNKRCRVICLLLQFNFWQLEATVLFPMHLTQSKTNRPYLLNHFLMSLCLCVCNSVYYIAFFDNVSPHLQSEYVFQFVFYCSLES